MEVSSSRFRVGLASEVSAYTDRADLHSDQSLKPAWQEGHNHEAVLEKTDGDLQRIKEAAECRTAASAHSPSV
jgi:hypothetical protein